MYCGKRKHYSKSQFIVVGMIRVQLTRSEKVAFHEKYHVLMNRSEDHKIGTVLHQNIGYNQRGREGISSKCSFFLELREMSLKLNFKRLKVVCYRCLQTLITFFSFFNNTWQFLKHSNVSLYYFTTPILQLQTKCLQFRREAGWCLYPFLVAFDFNYSIFQNFQPKIKTFQPNLVTNVK